MPTYVANPRNEAIPPVIIEIKDAFPISEVREMVSPELMELWGGYDGHDNEIGFDLFEADCKDAHEMSLWFGKISVMSGGK